MLDSEDYEVYDSYSEIAADLDIEEELLIAQFSCPYGQPTVDEHGDPIDCEQCGGCNEELPF